MPNQIKSNQIKSNQIKSNQIKSNQIKSNQIKSNLQIKIRPNYINQNQTRQYRDEITVILNYIFQAVENNYFRASKLRHDSGVCSSSIFSDTGDIGMARQKYFSSKFIIKYNIIY